MKKEIPLIPGKWYISSKWNYFIGAKFSPDGSTRFSYYEAVGPNGLEKKNQTRNTGTDHQVWESFRILSPDELKEILPKNHPDLKSKVHEIW